MKAFNLLTGHELEFDDKTTAEYAVAYGHYVESANMASWFFSQLQDGKTDWLDGVNKGKQSVCCGEWAALIETKKAS